jgi:hypothetical protein
MLSAADLSIYMTQVTGKMGCSVSWNYCLRYRKSYDEHAGGLPTDRWLHVNLAEKIAMEDTDMCVFVLAEADKSV